VADLDAPFTGALPEALASDALPADVSVVVCAYTLDRWADLERAVGSLLAQAEPVGEVLLVVDHSDALLDAARRRWPDLAVVASTGPKGLSGARDTGAALARGTVVAYLDDDAAAAPDWSARLAAAYGPGVLGVGGHIAPRWPAGRRPSWWPPAFDWVVGCSYQGLPERTARVRNVIGANMSVRRDVLLAVGGFDGRVGRVGAAATGCEETEMYIRAAAATGGHVVYEPAARVEHTVAPQRVSWRYFLRRCGGEGRSKAVVAALAGADSALASERAYTTRVLPRAFVRGLLSRDPRRGVAVVLGLVWTASGYLAGRRRRT
jgi:glycosyltransferase involved in cell wall biosynthesis